MITEALYTITVVNPCLNPTVVLPTIPANAIQMTLTDTSTQSFDFQSTFTFSPSICPNEAELVDPASLSFVQFTSNTRTVVINPNSDFINLAGNVEKREYTL